MTRGVDMPNRVTGVLIGASANAAGATLRAPTEAQVMTTSPKLPTDAMIADDAAIWRIGNAIQAAWSDSETLPPIDLSKMEIIALGRAALTAALAVAPRDERSCTCHPDDNPPQPCPKKYALSECRNAADDAFNAGLEMGARVADHAGSWRIATAIRASKRDRAEARADIAINERGAAQAETARLLGGLHAIADAHEHAPASVLRSIAYDVVMNCIMPDVAEFQIERRSAIAGDATQAALRVMREALEPFAAIADWFDSFDRPPPDSDLLAYGDEETHLRVGNFRRARGALASSGAAREEEGK